MKVITGNLDLRFHDLYRLPDLSEVEVTGAFVCHHNSLKSLEGSPRKVFGNCYNHDNLLTSLEGAPKEVGRDFTCSNNLLTSLKGSPEKVGGDFYCYNNSKDFTREDVRKVCKVGGKIYV